MTPIIILTVIIISAVAQANDIGIVREEMELEDKTENKDDNLAFESFGAPVYGPNEIITSGSGKSGFTLPVPATLANPALPVSYSAYLSTLGLGYGSAFNRYGIMPFPISAAYASPYNGLGYAPYVSSVGPGLGNNAGFTYGNSPFGRSTFGGYTYGYPGYANQGYRYGELGYAAAPVKSAPAPIPIVPTVRAPLPPLETKDTSLRYGYGSPISSQRFTLY